MSMHSANGVPTVEVVTGAHRRCWTLQEKLRVVEEASQPGMSVSFVARQHGIAPNLLFRWRKLMSQGGKEAVKADSEVVSVTEVNALKRQVRELQRLLGKKTMENEILRDALALARGKKLISRTPLPFEEDTLKSNLRWCSDGFEIACLDGEAVRVAFPIDCCDREAIGFVASTGGISGSMIRDLMLESVERRFGAPQTPHPVEWLFRQRELLHGLRDGRLCPGTGAQALLHAGQKP